MLSGVGALLAALGAFICTVVRYGWKLHMRRMSQIAKALEDLAKGILKAEEMAKDEHRKIWDAVQGIRAEIKLSSERTENLKASLLKTEGGIVLQADRLDKFLVSMSVVSLKLDKVFQFIDAPKRATDG